MFTAYARAIYAKTHGGNAGVPMRTAYMLANGVHDLLAAAQPDLAATRLRSDDAPSLSSRAQSAVWIPSRCESGSKSTSARTS